MKFELVGRSFVPLLKAALFGNDAKDAYGDECTAAAADAASGRRNPSSYRFSS
jgi:hypothetical protein